MSYFESDECYYNGTGTSSITFTSTLVVHAIFLVTLLIWCIIWFFYCLLHIKDKNHKSGGIYTTVAKDAPENGINYKRWKDYFMMAWTFFQLFSFSFLDEFSIKSSDDSVFSVTWIDNAIYYAKFILLRIGWLGDFVLFFVMLFVIIVCIGVFFFFFCYKDYWEFNGCGLEPDCRYMDYCPDFKKDCCSSPLSFFQAFFFYFLCGLFHVKKNRANDYQCFLCCMLKYNCQMIDNACECCGFKLKFDFLKYIPFFLKTIVYDFLYVPLLSSLIKVFVCTYTCNYNSSLMTEEDAYPPLDAYTSISCNSSYTIICFLLTLFAIAFYHVRASYYICVELDEDYSGDISINQRFQYIQMIGKFSLTVLSTMFYFKPFIPLSFNLAIFIFMLFTGLKYPARTAFTMEHNRLYISLYIVQVLTAFMALISQIFSTVSSLLSVLTICLIPFGFVIGLRLRNAPSLKDTFPYMSLRSMLNNNDSLKLLSVKILFELFGKENVDDEEKEKKKKKKCCSGVNRCIDKAIDFFSFHSIFHRGFTLNDLKMNAGDVLMEDIRKGCEILLFDGFDETLTDDDEDKKMNKDKEKDEDKELKKVKGKSEDENLQKVKETSSNKTMQKLERMDPKEYKIKVADSLSILNKHEKESICRNRLKYSDFFDISFSFLESFSLILTRDDYFLLSNLGEMEEGFKNNVAGILVELIQNTSNNLASDKFFLLDKAIHFTYRDYLLFFLYNPNSLSHSLQFTYLYRIFLNFSYFLFGLPNYFCFYSNLMINDDGLSYKNPCYDITSYSSFCYLTGKKIEECLHILLPCFIKENDIVKESICIDNNIRNKDVFFLKKEREFIEKSCENNELFIDVVLKILILSSSLFKSDWRYCAFFVNYINKEKFVSTFRVDGKYKRKVGDIIVKKIFNREKNDLWLLNKTDGIYFLRKLNDDNLYLVFETDERFNKKLIKTFEQREILFELVENNFKKRYYYPLLKNQEKRKDMTFDNSNNNNKSLILNEEIRKYLQLLKKKNNNKRGDKKQKDEENDDDDILEESVSESSEITKAKYYIKKNNGEEKNEKYDDDDILEESETEYSELTKEKNEEGDGDILEESETESSELSKEKNEEDDDDILEESETESSEVTKGKYYNEKNNGEEKSEKYDDDDILEESETESSEEMKDGNNLYQKNKNYYNYSAMNNYLSESSEVAYATSVENENNKEQKSEESDDSSDFKLSLTESSEEVEVNNLTEKIKGFISLGTFHSIPIIIRYIMLSLCSEVDVIREFAFLTLGSLLDKEKINKEEEGEDIGPSVIYILIGILEKYGLLEEIKYSINIFILKKKDLKGESYVNDRRIEINLFHVFFKFIDDCFDMSVILDEKKRKELIIDNYCKKKVFKWIVSFYDYEEEKEKVIRLLYILISCSKENVVSSLFTFEESSVFVLLLENEGSENIYNMSFLSTLQVIDSFIYNYMGIIDEELTKFILGIISLFLYKVNLYYVFPVLKIFLEKYCFFGIYLSNVNLKKLGEEFFEFHHLKLDSDTFITSFSSIHPIYLDNEIVKTVNNKIINYGDNQWKSYIFDKEMKKV